MKARPRKVPKQERPLCGAHCRSTGRPCQARVCVRPDGSLAKRCRLHGGLSTGPRSADGKIRAVVAMIEGRHRWWKEMRRRFGAHWWLIVRLRRARGAGKLAENP